MKALKSGFTKENPAKVSAGILSRMYLPFLSTLVFLMGCRRNWSSKFSAFRGSVCNDSKGRANYEGGGTRKSCWPLLAGYNHYGCNVANLVNVPKAKACTPIRGSVKNMLCMPSSYA